MNAYTKTACKLLDALLDIDPIGWRVLREGPGIQVEHRDTITLGVGAGASLCSTSFGVQALARNALGIGLSDPSGLAKAPLLYNFRLLRFNCPDHMTMYQRTGSLYWDLDVFVAQYRKESSHEKT